MNLYLNLLYFSLLNIITAFGFSLVDCLRSFCILLLVDKKITLKSFLLV